MELSKTSYVILGMLRLGKRTGYEIKSLVDVSTRFFWAASYGQIYPELKRLEKLGLVRATGEGPSGRRRKAYELTADGARELDDWLRSTEPLHFELRHEGLLKLFFSDGLSAPELSAQWGRIREEHELVARQLRSIEPEAAAERDNAKRMPLEVLEFGIAYQDFVISYCKRMEGRES